MKNVVACRKSERLSRFGLNSGKTRRGLKYVCRGYYFSLINFHTGENSQKKACRPQVPVILKIECEFVCKKQTRDLLNLFEKSLHAPIRFYFSQKLIIFSVISKKLYYIYLLFVISMTYLFKDFLQISIQCCRSLNNLLRENF